MNDLSSRNYLTSNDEVDLRAVFQLLLRNYRLIIGVSFSFALIGALVSLFVLDPVYESSSVIMPSKDQSMSGRLNSIFGNSSLSQFLNFGGATQEVTQHYELLLSQALVSKVIEDHNLVEKFEVEVDATDPLGKEKAHFWLVRQLQEKVEVLMDGNILRITYRNTDPLLAFEVIDAYLKKLTLLVQTNITTTAQSTQNFIQKRLVEAEEQLKISESEYLALQNTKGVVELPSQLGLTLNTASLLRNQLIEKEMEIELYKNILKDSSEIQRLESEKVQIQSQLDRLIQGRQKKGKDDKMEVFTPLGEGASLSFQFANAERNYLMYVKLVELLQQQLELARIETKKQEPMFQIIDPPVASVLPVGPNKKLITALSFLLGLFLSCIAVLFAGSSHNLPRRIYRIVKVNVRKKPGGTLEDEIEELELEPLKGSTKS